MRERLPSMSEYRLDRGLVDSFLRDALDEQGQATLAEQVAGLLPFHSELPTDIVARLSRLVADLGGEPQLLAWLDSFPGRQRLVARMFTLIGLLDQVSAEPAVAAVLREYRARTPTPPGLEPYLPPHTDDDTIASLSWEMESMLGDDRPDDAVRLAEATVALIREITPRAIELDPDVEDLLRQIDTAQHALTAVSAGGPRWT